MTRRSAIGAIGIAGALALALTPSTAKAADGAGPVLPQPCAACHLPSASGIPGTFPPLRENLRALAATPAGRRYIVLVVSYGLAGALTVEGKRFNGVMPPQALKDDEIARILNGLIGGAQRAFTGREVAGIRATGSGLSGAQVARLRPALPGR